MYYNRDIKFIKNANIILYIFFKKYLQKINMPLIFMPK